MSIVWILILLLAGLFVFLLMGESGGRIARRKLDAYVAEYGKYVTRSVVVPTLVFVALAIVMRDIILTPFLLVVGAGVAYFRLQEVIAKLNTITPRQVSQLVLAFQGAYQIVPAVFKSLELILDRIEEPLRDIVSVAVETYFTAGSSDRAFDVFRERGKNPLLNQFVYILEMSESATNESVISALDDLVTRLRRHDELVRQVETGLASITGQTGFMQALAVIIVFVIALVPGFRIVYVSSGMGRIGFMALVLIILASSYLIERRNQTLKEQIL